MTHGGRSPHLPACRATACAVLLKAGLARRHCTWPRALKWPKSSAMTRQGQRFSPTGGSCFWQVSFMEGSVLDLCFVGDPVAPPPPSPANWITWACHLWRFTGTDPGWVFGLHRDVKMSRTVNSAAASTAAGVWGRQSDDALETKEPVEALVHCWVEDEWWSLLMKPWNTDARPVVWSPSLVSCFHSLTSWDL